MCPFSVPELVLPFDYVSDGISQVFDFKEHTIYGFRNFSLWLFQSVGIVKKQIGFFGYLKKLCWLPVYDHGACERNKKQCMQTMLLSIRRGRTVMTLIWDEAT